MPRPWPVLLMARELGLGGSERQLAETAMALDRSRFAPHAGCFRGGGFHTQELLAAGIPVLELGVRSLVSWSLAAGAYRLHRYVAERGIALVHAFDVPLDLFSVPVARLSRVPVVLSSQRAHRALTPGFRRHLLRLTDRIADGVVVNSKAVARELAEEDGVPASMLRLAYNGVDTDIFHPDGTAAKTPWPEAAAVIGVVCALRPEKGLPLLMDAYAMVRRQRPGIKLLIVGSGPMLPELEQRASALGLGPDCHFESAARDVAEWLRAIDIFVLPSLSEALSNALMEAMACGCCPLASDVGGNPEVIVHGETGLLFANGKTEELASCLAAVLDDAALRRRLGVSATCAIAQRFSRQAAAQRMGGIYLEYLERR